MNIREAAKDVIINGIWCDYNVGYINDDGNHDETQLNANCLDELETTWNDLQEELGHDGTVEYVELVPTINEIDDNPDHLHLHKGQEHNNFMDAIMNELYG